MLMYFYQDKTIFHPKSNKCLTLIEASMDLEMDLEMSFCTGAQEQLFVWKPVTVPTEYLAQMKMPVPVNRIIGLQ